MSRSHHASDCRSGTIGATVSYTGSVFCSVSMSTNRRVHTPLHLICIQCRTNSLFCISERPLGRGDTSIFNLAQCISTGILSCTASLYNTSTSHRNLYVGITESIVTQQSPHGTYCFLFFIVFMPPQNWRSIQSHFCYTFNMLKNLKLYANKNIFFIFFLYFFNADFLMLFHTQHHWKNKI